MCQSVHIDDINYTGIPNKHHIYVYIAWTGLGVIRIYKRNGVWYKIRAVPMMVKQSILAFVSNAHELISRRILISE